MTHHVVALYIAFSGGLIGAGIIAGLIAGLLGVGGGIIIVPVLYSLFSFMHVDNAVNMHLAIGTSLSTIVVTAITSTRAHLQRGSVDKILLRNWAPWIIMGVVVGAVLAGYASTRLLIFIFASVSMLVAIYMTMGGAQARYIASSLPTGMIRHSMGFLVGCLSSLMGIGGGTLTVPILSLCRYPIRKAVGTAAAIGLIVSIPGTLSAVISGFGRADLPPFSLGYVNILGFVLLVPLTASLAPIGARVAHSIDERLLRYAFAIFLFTNAIHMLVDAL